jgi:hypothetical protein
MWPSPLPAYAGAAHLAPNLALRRHRSMTPHAPNVSNYVPDHWLGDQGRVPRPFPHAVGGIFGSQFNDESYHRATSLDPSTLNVRASPLHLQAPHSLNRLAMGSTTATGDGPLGQFGIQAQPDLGDISQMDTTTTGDLKRTLADEYTNWEQHNA